jgi:hypothetical protein
MGASKISTTTLFVIRRCRSGLLNRPVRHCTAEFYLTVQTQPVAMATPILEVTPVVEVESVSQVYPGPEWPPKGWTIYLLALSIDPSSSVGRPNLMEYLFDEDTLTFFHPSTISTSHLSESSSLQGSKRKELQR